MKVEHVAISVTSLEESSKFYQKYFGFTEGKRYEKQDSKFIYLSLGDFQIELWQFKQNQKPIDDLMDIKVLGLRHLAFVVDDVPFEIDRLRKLGLVVDDFKIGSTKRKFTIVKDPDGIALEIIEKV